jgi:hypothetical protein
MILPYNDIFENMILYEKMVILLTTGVLTGVLMGLSLWVIFTLYSLKVI